MFSIQDVDTCLSLKAKKKKKETAKLFITEQAVVDFYKDSLVSVFLFHV